jgi:hypothetical protein
MAEKLGNSNPSIKKVPPEFTDEDIELVDQNIDDKWNGRGTKAYSEIRIPLTETDNLEVSEENDYYHQGR